MKHIEEGKKFMKIFKINDRKCLFSIDGINYKAITDISKEDIYKILDYMYFNDDYEFDNLSSNTVIANEADRIIYENLTSQFETFIQNKNNLVSQIENEFKEAIEKYKDVEEESK